MKKYALVGLIIGCFTLFSACYHEGAGDSAPSNSISDFDSVYDGGDSWDDESASMEDTEDSSSEIEDTSNNSGDSSPDSSNGESKEDSSSASGDYELPPIPW